MYQRTITKAFQEEQSLLIRGSTGSGLSIFLNWIILQLVKSILYNPCGRLFVPSAIHYLNYHQNSTKEKLKLHFEKEQTSLDIGISKIPLFIQLSHFNDYFSLLNKTDWENENCFLDYLGKHLSLKGNTSLYAEEYVHYLVNRSDELNNIICECLKCGRAVIIVDEIDLITNSPYFNLILCCLDKFISKWIENNQNQIIFAERSINLINLNQYMSLKRLTKVKIKKLPRELGRLMIEKNIFAHLSNAKPFNNNYKLLNKTTSVTSQFINSITRNSISKNNPLYTKYEKGLFHWVQSEKEKEIIIDRTIFSFPFFIFLVISVASRYFRSFDKLTLLSPMELYQSSLVFLIQFLSNEKTLSLTTNHSKYYYSIDNISDLSFRIYQSKEYSNYNREIEKLITTLPLNLLPLINYCTKDFSKMKMLNNCFNDYLIGWNIAKDAIGNNESTNTFVDSLNNFKLHSSLITSIALLHSNHYIGKMEKFLNEILNQDLRHQFHIPLSSLLLVKSIIRNNLKSTPQIILHKVQLVLLYKISEMKQTIKENSILFSIQNAFSDLFYFDNNLVLQLFISFLSAPEEYVNIISDIINKETHSTNNHTKIIYNIVSGIAEMIDELNLYNYPKLCTLLQKNCSYLESVSPKENKWIISKVVRKFCSLKPPQYHGDLLHPLSYTSLPIFSSIKTILLDKLNEKEMNVVDQSSIGTLQKYIIMSLLGGDNDFDSLNSYYNYCTLSYFSQICDSSKNYVLFNSNIYINNSLNNEDQLFGEYEKEKEWSEWRRGEENPVEFMCNVDNQGYFFREKLWKTRPSFQLNRLSRYSPLFDLSLNLETGAGITKEILKLVFTRSNSPLELDIIKSKLYNLLYYYCSFLFQESVMRSDHCKINSQQKSQVKCIIKDSITALISIGEDLLEILSKRLSFIDINSNSQNTSNPGDEFIDYQLREFIFKELSDFEFLSEVIERLRDSSARTRFHLFDYVSNLINRLSDKEERVWQFLFSIIHALSISSPSSFDLSSLLGYHTQISYNNCDLVSLYLLKLDHFNKSFILSLYLFDKIISYSPHSTITSDSESHNAFEVKSTTGISQKQMKLFKFKEIGTALELLPFIHFHLASHLPFVDHQSCNHYLPIINIDDDYLSFEALSTIERLSVQGHRQSLLYSLIKRAKDKKNKRIFLPELLILHFFTVQSHPPHHLILSYDIPDTDNPDDDDDLPYYTSIVKRLITISESIGDPYYTARCLCRIM